MIGLETVLQRFMSIYVYGFTIIGLETVLQRFMSIYVYGFTIIGLETVLQRFMSMVMACTHPSDLLHKFDGVFILRWVLVEVGLQAIPECFVDDLLYSLLQTRRKKRKKVWKI